jgi:hypothetical protein
MLYRGSRSAAADGALTLNAETVRDREVEQARRKLSHFPSAKRDVSRSGPQHFPQADHAPLIICAKPVPPDHLDVDALRRAFA